MKLVINLFNEEPQTHEVHGSAIYVGRSSQCDVVINHESMSRKHCLIEFEDGQIFVTDLGSTNGVSIDGNRVTPNEKTFYLNSLPLMIGAANVTIDLTDHKTQTISLKTSPQASKNITSTKTVTISNDTKKVSNTASNLELKNKSAQKGKSKPSKKASSGDDDKKKKEILFAIMAVLAFVAMAGWYFTQN